MNIYRETAYTIKSPDRYLWVAADPHAGADTTRLHQALMFRTAEEARKHLTDNPDTLEGYVVDEIKLNRQSFGPAIPKLPPDQATKMSVYLALDGHPDGCRIGPSDGRHIIYVSVQPREYLAAVMDERGNVTVSTIDDDELESARSEIEGDL